MQDKLLSKNRLGEFISNPWDGTNRSGHEPIGDRVLILPDKCVEKTTGGIFLPENMKEKLDLASETGIIVAIGDGAWTWNADRTRRFEGVRPQVGQRVSFTRYSGDEILGDDGEMYRAMSDASITTIRAAQEASGAQERAA